MLLSKQFNCYICKYTPYGARQYKQFGTYLIIDCNIMSSFVNGVIANFKDVVLNKYVKFDGRANRSEFWQFVLAVFLIGLAFSILGVIFAKVKVIVILLNILNGLVSLALLLPSIAVAVRRLSDIGKSWPWIFINFIPLIGQIWFLILMATPSKSK